MLSGECGVLVCVIIIMSFAELSAVLSQKHLLVASLKPLVILRGALVSNSDHPTL